jgi:hypothetical protein
MIIFILFVSGCNVKYPSEKCEYGKRKIKINGTVIIKPSNSYNAPLYHCYNASECIGTTRCREYTAIGDTEAQWFQIIQTYTGKMMINVSAEIIEADDTQPGWIECKEVEFIEDDDFYANKLTKVNFDLYQLCKND